MFVLLLTVGVSASFILAGCGASSSEQPVITIDPTKTYQTIIGWEATAGIGQVDYPTMFFKWRDTVLDLAVNDLGINRIRVEIQSGIENPVDYFTPYNKGQIPRSEWRKHWYEVINDNDDPFVINPRGFQFSRLDFGIENVVLPLKRRLEAKGEKLYINVCYVAFGSSAFEHKDFPEEYAEFVLATYRHLHSQYRWAPDAWEVILEPDNARWSGSQIGNAIVAAANRLKANGFHPAFIAPSNKNMASAIAWFDQMIRVPGVLHYLSELSYHRYGGVSDVALQAIGNRALQYGVKTAHLERIGATYHDLHADLKIARNSAWAQYGLAGPEGGDDGGKYYHVDISDANNPIVKIGSRTKFLRQYFRYIRRGAVRIEATTNNNDFDPLAFINANGKYVVVVKANRGGSFAIQRVPAGTYGVKHTTSRQYDVDAPDVTISDGHAVNVSIPESGVITVYAKASSTP